MHWLDFRPQDHGWLLAALLTPLAGYAIQIFFGKHLPRKGDWLLTGGMFFTMCVTIVMFAKSIYASQHGIEFRHHSGLEGGWWFRWLYSSDELAGASPNIK